MHGSSPRLRGTPADGIEAHVIGRFIPASAGNTHRQAMTSRTTSVHPRVCGEHDKKRNPPVGNSGSSPRLRGTRVRPGQRDEIGRFIPASAGNTAASKTGRPSLAVHPRVCGEHRTASKAASIAAGSSPRLRGTRFFGRLMDHERRFIPASAGNTPSRDGRPSQWTVHPRVCGEHVWRASGPFSPDGSSPRLRGTPANDVTSSTGYRFIPASAGNTLGETHRLFARSVHPRVCGEHSGGIVPAVGPGGSSPRLRGTRTEGELSRSSARFIPASAGNTRPWGSHCRGRTVHPRVCGEHSEWETLVECKTGSSPRLRGTLAPRR